MLKSLTVSNFKAFKKEVKIDLSATGNYTFNTEAIKENIVKTAVMYGKNASGKSSIGLAIFDIVGTLTDNYVPPCQYTNFKNLFSNDNTVSFEYTFTFDNIDVIYSYTKDSHGNLISEELRIDNTTFAKYDRLQSPTKIELNFQGAENVVLNLNQLSFSILRFIKSNVMLAEDNIKVLFEKFYNFVNRMLMFWSLEDRGFIVDKIVKDNHFSDLQDFFKAAGFEDTLDHTVINGVEQLVIKYNDQTLDFHLAASSGMKSLLLVFFWLKNLADKNKCPSFIFIDEFDAFYHFELSYFILERLKKYDCQVLLTTHNTSLFTNDLLRPDCYFICSKDKIVNAYNSTNQEIRFGHNLEKLYRSGKFNK